MTMIASARLTGTTEASTIFGRFCAILVDRLRGGLEGGQPLPGDGAYEDTAVPSSGGRERRSTALIRTRSLVLLGGSVAVAAAATLIGMWMLGATAEESGGGLMDAQEGDCRFFTVAADTLNIFREPHSQSGFVASPGKTDIVCVARDRKVGDHVWAYILYRVEKGERRTAMTGWATKRSLRTTAPDELAAARALAQSVPKVAETPAAATRALRFSDPITFGPLPVNGHSLEQLIDGTPTFPPIEGLPETAWKKTCSSCHKWTRQALCTQAGTYATRPSTALRVAHPYGGAEKTAMMRWAENGCP
jgi:hypothetical protein